MHAFGSDPRLRVYATALWPRWAAAAASRFLKAAATRPKSSFCHSTSASPAESWCRFGKLPIIPPAPQLYATAVFSSPADALRRRSPIGCGCGCRTYERRRRRVNTWQQDGRLGEGGKNHSIVYEVIRFDSQHLNIPFAPCKNDSYLRVRYYILLWTRTFACAVRVRCPFNSRMRQLPTCIDAIKPLLTFSSVPSTQVV